MVYYLGRVSPGHQVSPTVTEIVSLQSVIVSPQFGQNDSVGFGQRHRQRCLVGGAQRLFLCEQAERRDQFPCGGLIAHDNRLIFH